MKKSFNYFYKITNLVNNKYYYGVHKTNNIDDGYMGSGKRLKYAFGKYSIENFKKEILEYFNTYEDALKYESEIVSERLVNDNNCYNLKIGGTGGNGWVYANNGEKMITVIDKNENKYIRVNVDSEYFKNDALRNIKDISDADKIKWFDKTFKSALGYITQIEKDGYAREDNSHYAYEEFLEILISDRKTFWKYYNSISDN